MKIIVDNKLTYECPYPVKIGDRVLLPDTGWVGHDWEATVTALDSDYTGQRYSVIAVGGTSLDLAIKKVKNLEIEAARIQKELTEAKERVIELTEEVKVA